ncbi:MAG TPA: serine/threonine-protein kinase [Thermoanaerobaculia bacterium]|jgi:serine/threonine-protein kinase|nr:serine/threonine-protein kinase [Thermoanaerobaculia bacterium]
MVTPERWQQIKVVLEGALDRQEAERTAFLDAACEGDDELRREVESLVASEPDLGDFIETPVFRIRPEEDVPLAAGQRIGAYRVVRELGRGGMGSVYLAERADEEFEQRVALKLVRRGMDTDEIVRRFRSERQILAHLDHPNIAKLFDGGTTEDGRPYFIMEYVEGQPIDEYCDERKLPTRERLELFRQVCSAVHFAHQNLIVHRDLKPGNILVTAGGVPKLLDFGIAKLLDPDQALFALTRVEQRLMTPEYASPEQVRGETITTASDIYSLGVLLYVLLTGHRPYPRATQDPQSLAQAICETEPLRPSSAVSRVAEVRQPDGTVVELKPESVSRVRDGEQRLLRRRLAGDLDNIILMAMRKDPQRRYASVAQLSNDIERHLQGLPVVARKDTLGYRARKFVGRHKLGVAAAVTVLLLIVGFSIMVTVLWQRAVREQQRAQAVSGFLEELFSIPNPSESRGESVTAREMLDRGVEKIASSLEKQPELRADLMSTMGRVYRSLGLNAPAKKLLESSLDLHRRALERADPHVTNDLHNLASVLREMGKDAEAEPLVREALRLQRQRGETQNIDYASGLTNLASILEDKGELDQAEAYYKQSLAIKRKLPQVDDEDIATSLNNLGKLYATRGNYDAAELNYRESLKLRLKIAGGLPDPEVAASLGNIASLLQDRGDLAGAETFHRQVLEMRRKLYPGSSPKIAVTLNNLGYVYQAEGKTADAEKCYREALSIADTKLPPDHPIRAAYLRNLASVLVAEGKAVEAEAKAREALSIFRAKQPTFWRVADTESVLGSCLTALGRFEEAEKLLLASYPALENDKGDGAKHVAEARQRIVELYTKWGRPEGVAAYRAKL